MSVSVPSSIIKTCFLPPSDFLYFWSIIFLITTTLVCILKRETDVAEVNTKLDDVELVDTEQGVWDTYQLLVKIVRLPAVLSLMGVLLTVKVRNLSLQEGCQVNRRKNSLLLLDIQLPLRGMTVHPKLKDFLKFHRWAQRGASVLSAQNSPEISSLNQLIRIACLVIG